MRRLTDQEAEARRRSLSNLPIVLDTTELLLKHWLDAARNILLPSRDNIDPSQLMAALPFIIIHQFEAPGRSIIRLAGTSIYESLGRELTGTNYFDLVEPNRREQASRRLETVLRHPCGLLSRIPYMLKSGAQGESESLGLPLIGRSGAIDTIIFINQRLPPERVTGARPDDAQGVDAVDASYVDIGAGIPGTPP